MRSRIATHLSAYRHGMAYESISQTRHNPLCRTSCLNATPLGLCRMTNLPIEPGISCEEQLHPAKKER